MRGLFAFPWSENPKSADEAKHNGRRNSLFLLLSIIFWPLQRPLRELYGY